MITSPSADARLTSMRRVLTPFAWVRSVRNDRMVVALRDHQKELREYLELEGYRCVSCSDQQGCFQMVVSDKADYAVCLTPAGITVGLYPDGFKEEKRFKMVLDGSVSLEYSFLRKS